MISSFSYLSPVQEAYSKVVESETNPSPSETKELLDSKKGSPYRMSDEERMLFYQDEIKRLRRIQKYYEQQRRYSLRNVSPQGFANYAIENTIEKYQRELEKMRQNQQKQQKPQNTAQPTNSIPVKSSSPSSPSIPSL